MNAQGSEESQPQGNDVVKLEDQKLAAEVANLRLDRERKRRERHWWARPHVIVITVPLLTFVAATIFNVLTCDVRLKRARLEADQAQFDLQVATRDLADAQKNMSIATRDVAIAREKMSAIQTLAKSIESELNIARNQLHAANREGYTIVSLLSALKSDFAQIPDERLRKELSERVTRIVGPGFGRFTRTQKEVGFGDGTGVWTVAVDVSISFCGSLPADQIIGSVSTQPSAVAKTFIALARWSDPDTATNWDADVVWFQPKGAQETEKIPIDGFQNLKVDHWYRWSWTFDLDTGQILRVSITDLSDGNEALYEPPDRYLFGGRNAKQHSPTRIRYFAGSATNAGNTMTLLNLVVEEFVDENSLGLDDEQ